MLFSMHGLQHEVGFEPIEAEVLAPPTAHDLWLLQLKFNHPVRGRDERVYDPRFLERQPKMVSASNRSQAARKGNGTGNRKKQK